jgi:hypothetical protein
MVGFIIVGMIVVAAAAVAALIDYRKNLIPKRIIRTYKDEADCVVAKRDIDIYLVNEQGTTTNDILEEGSKCPKLQTGEVKLVLKSGATPTVNVDRDLKYVGNLLSLAGGTAPLIIDKHDKLKIAKYARTQQLLDKISQFDINEVEQFVDEIESRKLIEAEDLREELGEVSDTEITNRIVEEKSKMGLTAVSPVSPRERLAEMSKEQVGGESDEHSRRKRLSDVGGD